MWMVKLIGPGGLGRVMAAGAAAIGLFLVDGAEAAAQQGTVQFTVSGTSTVRGWTCSVPGTAEVTQGSLDAVEAATLTVQVADFECPQDEMREHLLEAMRATEFPQITFQLDGYESTAQGASTSGSLTILDSTQAVSFPFSVSPSGGGVQLQGELPLDMTSYGVEPPVVMMGLLRVRPQIRIQFSGMVGS